MHLCSHWESLWSPPPLPWLQSNLLTSFPTHQTHQYKCKLGEATSCKSAVNTHQGAEQWTRRAASYRAAHPFRWQKEYLSPSQLAGKSTKKRGFTQGQKHLCEPKQPSVEYERVNGTSWWLINNLIYSWPNVLLNWLTYDPCFHS